MDEAEETLKRGDAFSKRAPEDTIANQMMEGAALWVPLSLTPAFRP